MKIKKSTKPIIAWMAWNNNNPWPCSVRSTRKECIKAVKENLIDIAA